MALQQEVSVKSELGDEPDPPESEIMNEKLIDDLANDYSNYLNFDVSKEQKKFNDSIEDMLTKLDEFCGLVDMIRSDTSLCLTKTVPDIQSKCTEMEVLFNKIDNMEAFVAVVKQDVSKMEEYVNRAEDEFGSLGGFVKKITSIVSPKRSLESIRSKQTEFIPPEIFQTNKFFEPPPPASETASAAAPETAQA